MEEAEDILIIKTENQESAHLERLLLGIAQQKFQKFVDEIGKIIPKGLLFLQRAKVFPKPG
ncbi:MAG: hypothetical protein ABIJ25_07230 [Pseudomonadota bacterium]